MAKDMINLTDKDFKRKSFKIAPGGIYVALITKKSQIKPSKSGGGNNLNVHAKIVKGPHKGITFFDNIAPHVAWKVAQLLNAIQKKLKKLTLQQLLKLVVGKTVRVQLRQDRYQGRDQNKVVTWLPLKGQVTAGGEDEEEEEDEDEQEEMELDEDEEESEDEESEDETEDDENEEDEDDEEEEPAEDDEEEEDSDLVPEDDEDEEESEEEEEEEEKSRKRSKKSKREKKSKKKSRR